MDLYEVADELLSRRPNLPHGIEIKVDAETKFIFVVNDELGFGISGETIERGHHLAAFDSTVARLIEILDEGTHLRNPELFCLCAPT